MRNINIIIIHCSATRPNMDIGLAEIRDWHVNGNAWSDVGYHRIIRRDGTLENGRSFGVAGAHCKGHNHDSIGICLVGGVTENNINIPENNFTEAQFIELERLLKELLADHTNITHVYGHSNFANKDCPCFDVIEWLKDVGLEKYVGRK